MLGQKNWLVILVKSHELGIMSPTTGSSSTLAFPTTVINNLEVIDRDGLYSLIAAWAKEHTYQTTELVWLLSPSVIFEQTFPDSEKERWDTQIVQFLDSVPFETLLSRVYNPVEGRRVVATNQDLVNVLTQGFAIQGYLTRAIVPANTLGIDSPLTQSSTKHVINNLSQLLRENLITPTLDNPGYHPINNLKPNETAGTPKPKSSLPLLLGVFLTLLVILVIVIVLNQ